MTPQETKERAELVAQRAVILDLVETSFAPGSGHRELFNKTREEILRMVDDCDTDDDRAVLLLAIGVAGIDVQLESLGGKIGSKNSKYDTIRNKENLDSWIFYHANILGNKCDPVMENKGSEGMVAVAWVDTVTGDRIEVIYD